MNSSYKKSLGRLFLALLGALPAWSASPSSKPFTPQDRSYWAFQAVRRPPLPTVRNRGWVRNPIDAFILRRLEAEGIVPGPQADKITILRRVSFDLTGLPPAPEEVQAFLSDTTPTAYERVVD